MLAARLDVGFSLANPSFTLDNAPSSYVDFLEKTGEGMQHVAYWTEDFDGELARAKEHGRVAVQSGQSGGPDGRFIYYETAGHPGTVLEVSEISGAKGRFFDHVRKTALEWDGTQEPVRRMGQR